jgi:hypothetical protein
MPIGAQMHVAGTLERGPLGFAVRSGTGLTQIGHPRGARRLIGCSVEVEGRRTAFDETTCDRIWQQGAPKPAAAILPSLEYALIGGFIIYGVVANLASLIG